MKKLVAFTLTLSALGGCARSFEAPPPLEPEPTHTGFVAVSMGGVVDEDRASLNGFFLPLPYDDALGAHSDCALVEERGRCARYRCTDDAAVGGTESAGTIDVFVDGAPMISAVPRDGRYRSVGGAPQEAGVPLLVRASGADVPAFEVGLEAPSEPVIDTPPEVTTNRAWWVDWEPGDTDEEVSVTLFALDPLTAVQCSADASDGALEVPVEMLGALAPGDGTLHLSIERARRIDAGEYRVEVVTQRVLREGYVAIRNE